MHISIEAKFLGGLADKENLTGSCTFVSIRRGKKLTNLLIDAGMWQGNFKKSIQKNRAILGKIDLPNIDYIILTHSHVDHIGRLPLLVNEGFKGQIICTQSTRNLLPIMLDDVAKIQESESWYLWKTKQKRKKKKFNNAEINERRKHYALDKTNPYKPLFRLKDVEKVEKIVKNGGFEYDEYIKLGTGINLKFYPSGHVLGGAICVIQIKQPQGDKSVYLGFSGDLGRQDGIILPPPEIVKEPINYWFVESTYGDRTHPDRDLEITKIKELVSQAAKEKKKIIIPSFALERTQEIVYLLSYFMHTKEIPTIPIYLDSPLASKITNVYAHNWENGMFKDQGMLPFNPFMLYKNGNHFLRIVTDSLQSADLSKKSGPYIVIAGSGMCDAGRIRDHLRENLPKSKTIVCLIGYMAKGSLGRKLKDGLPLVRMNGEDVLVKAEIFSFDSFSAHADRPFIVGYTNQIMTRCKNADKKIFIVHGEERSAAYLKYALMNSEIANIGANNIIIPKINHSFDIL